MSKHGIIGRVTQLARADVDAIISSAEGPRQILDQLVRDYAANVAEAERAIVQLTGNLRLAADDQQEDARAVAAGAGKRKPPARTPTSFVRPARPPRPTGSTASPGLP